MEIFKSSVGFALNVVSSVLATAIWEGKVDWKLVVVIAAICTFLPILTGKLFDRIFRRKTIHPHSMISETEPSGRSIDFSPAVGDKEDQDSGVGF